jgi:hypothetical protein
MANSSNNNAGCTPDVCCFNIDASIETFLKLAEAVGWTVSTAVPA